MPLSISCVCVFSNAYDCRLKEDKSDTSHFTRIRRHNIFRCVGRDVLAGLTGSSGKRSLTVDAASSHAHALEVLCEPGALGTASSAVTAGILPRPLIYGAGTTTRSKVKCVPSGVLSCRDVLVG